MTTFMPERVRQTSLNLLMAASALAFGGCATATPSEQPKAPDFSCRTQPTTASTGKVAGAALLGAVLDKATGGGKGFERALGEAADANLHKKCAEAASSPALAPK